MVKDLGRRQRRFHNTNEFETKVSGHTTRAPHMAKLTRHLSPGVGIEPAIELSQIGRVTNCTTRSLLISKEGKSVE
jgi:hypothetical protein